MTSIDPGNASEGLEFQILPKTMLRRVTAKRMLISSNEKPHVTLHRSVCVDRLIEYLHETRNSVDDESRKHITLTSVFALVVSRALTSYGRLNGRTSEGDVHLYHKVNLGIAVQVDGGLVVPVIHDAANLDIFTLSARLYEVAQIARNGMLKPEHVTGATFTITNLGAFGISYFTPIINPPELAILGIGTIEEHIKFTMGEISEIKRIGLSLSFDHSASDGADAAELLSVIDLELQKVGVS